MTDEAALLARIDERVQSVQRELHIVRRELESNYVNVSRFAPIEKLVYGLTGTILLAFVGGVVAVVMKQ